MLQAPSGQEFMAQLVGAFQANPPDSTVGDEDNIIPLDNFVLDMARLQA